MCKTRCGCNQAVRQTLVDMNQFVLHPNTASSIAQNIPITPDFLTLAQLSLEHLMPGDFVLLNATVGSEVLSDSPELLYSIYRNTISPSNLIFSTKTELEGSIPNFSNEFSIDTFRHVDMNPTLGKVKYILTVECVDFNAMAQVVGPLTFVIQQIRKPQSGKCMCDKTVAQKLIDMNQFVLHPNTIEASSEDIPLSPNFLTLAELSLDNIMLKDHVLLEATVGTEALANVSEIIYKIYRNSVSPANLIFSAKTELVAGIDFNIDSLTHVDLNPPLGKVKYILTVEGLAQNAMARVIGPTTFVIQQISKDQIGKSSCSIPAKTKLIDVHQYVLNPNTSASIMKNIPISPQFLTLVVLIVDKVMMEEKIILNATIGSEVQDDSPELIYKIYRNTVNPTNLIFSAKTELENEVNDFSIDSFTHVDLKPTLGKVKYILTVENTDINSIGSIIGPITFTSKKIISS
ncbi:hypothetical protein [Bacillus sp. SM2101]|uniref:hypothetical protein n=1 Tax=Bacillus sp. SM2101 TaxID=2805366 RepID=UPI001BDEDC1A|nr:hypothetical protein [Bacillus sp. SM2101]